MRTITKSQMKLTSVLAAFSMVSTAYLMYEESKITPIRYGSIAFASGMCLFVCYFAFYNYIKYKKQNPSTNFKQKN